VTFNPYQPPVSAADPVGTDAAVSSRIVEALRKAKPWVSLVAISGLVMSVLSVLSGLLVILGAPDGATVGIGIFQLVWGGITFGAALPLNRCARAIRRLLHGGGMLELELALEAQTRFWQMAGLITLLSLLLFIGVLTISIFAAAFLASVF
jgi:hypothetical protein